MDNSALVILIIIGLVAFVIFINFAVPKLMSKAENGIKNKIGESKNVHKAGQVYRLADRYPDLVRSNSSLSERIPQQKQYNGAVRVQQRNGDFEERNNESDTVKAYQPPVISLTMEDFDEIAKKQDKPKSPEVGNIDFFSVPTGSDGV